MSQKNCRCPDRSRGIHSKTCLAKTETGSALGDIVDDWASSRSSSHGSSGGDGCVIDSLFLAGLLFLGVSALCRRR